jgi:predicted ArsR family transcriptional regulator
VSVQIGRREPVWLETIAEPTRLYILRFLVGVGEATAADLASGPASTQTLRRHLEALVSTGLIDEHPGESDGETPGRPAARFSLVPEIRESVASVCAVSTRSRPAPAAVR